jgi:hypothetical protein
MRYVATPRTLLRERAPSAYLTCVLLEGESASC